MKLTKIAFIFFGLSLLVSCATTIKNFDQYQKAPLLQTEFMPKASAIYKEVPVVLILPFQTNNKNAKLINAQSIVESNISDILLSNKLVSIQDRSQIQNLSDEIKLAEIQGQNTPELSAVDYAIDGEVSAVTFSSSYQAERRDHQGNIIQEDGYLYTASVTGFITIYQIPSLKVIEKIPFSGSYKKYENAIDRGISYKEFKLKNKANAKKFDENIVQNAIKVAIKKASKPLKSVFAKTGYIMEKRTLNDKNIFLISLGAKDGIGQESKVKILQKYKELNPLTKNSETLERFITTGTVADKTENTKTWVVIKDESKAKFIKLGDTAKIIY